jgi:alkylation response protein AidB-like acyl-CoA dehydrogenase
MRFAFSDEQLQAQASLRALLERECPPTAVRARWPREAPAGASDGAAQGEAPGRSLWERLGQLGIFCVLVPEAHGGLGANELDLVLLLEECGRAAVPEPIIETALVAAPLVAEAAPLGFQEQWLPRIASGEAMVSVGLSGSPYLLDADRSDLLLIEQQGALYALPPSAAALTRQASVDGARRLFRVTFRPADATLLCGGEQARDPLDRAFDRAALGAAATLLGLSRRMLDMTADYVKVRHQFGVPIGSFQAVKHPLASALVALEMARPAVYRAAYSLCGCTGEGEPAVEREVRVSAAKAHASDAAALCARTALQCHGAIGYSFEHDLHLFMKRAWALAAAWGDSSWHRERVARRVLDAPRGEQHAAGE